MQGIIQILFRGHTTITCQYVQGNRQKVRFYKICTRIGNWVFNKNFFQGSVEPILMALISFNAFTDVLIYTRHVHLDQRYDTNFISWSYDHYFWIYGRKSTKKLNVVKMRPQKTRDMINLRIFITFKVQDHLEKNWNVV